MSKATRRGGIPLYAAEEELHDTIVKKQGAFDRPIQSFAMLFEAGAAIELRTVVMRQNDINLRDCSTIATEMRWQTTSV
ncbi:hypothetical protein [Rhizobium sp. WSM1325]|uniref:hypothetical protein n=1 Tax=Rhizobium sp. WSM1325 TaxID=3444086 RepID=UPI001FE18621|nr:hypothetical protein [Rhizobium leguminosarum]